VQPTPPPLPRGAVMRAATESSHFGPAIYSVLAGAERLPGELELPPLLVAPLLVAPLLVAPLLLAPLLVVPLLE
jgi:hypothetical protein